MSERSLSIALLLAWCVSAAASLAACRVTTPTESLELEGAALLGVRRQPSGWENGSAPLARLDAAARPWSWPVGVKVSADVSGFFGDDTGEQTGGFGLGLARSFELQPERLAGSLGAGRLFLSTDDGGLFARESDSWQATYVEAGLTYRVDPERNLGLGLEARYSFGDGPELGGTRLDGDFLDLFLVLSFGWPGRRPGAARP